jgi:hypothetical protein
VRYQEGGPAALAPALRAHRKGLLDEAVEGYRRAVEQDPGCLDAWVNLGSLLASVGSASGAREAFAAARAGGDPRAQRDIAFGFLQIGDLDEARDGCRPGPRGRHPKIPGNEAVSLSSRPSRPTAGGGRGRGR